MAQVINTNIASINAQRNLNESQSSLNTSLERLSTGLRINSAKDDAAGLAIAERFTTQIRGLEQAQRNANDGISFAQTAEGALGTIGDALQRVRELAVQSINDTNSTSDRQALNNEVSQLLAEVGRVADSTQFNGKNILDGTATSLTFQVGANQGQTIDVDGVDARSSQLGAATATGNAITSSVLAGSSETLTIEGQDIDLSTIDSNTELVDAINLLAGDTGVQAQRDSSTSVDLTYVADTSTPADARTLTINNVDIAIEAGATAAQVEEAINAVSNSTGVTADNTSGNVINFSNTSGADITIGQDADSTDTDDLLTGGGGNLENAGGAAAEETFQAGITLSTDVGGSPTITATNSGLTEAGLGSVTGNFEDDVLSDVDVLTGANASDALRTLDFALQQVNGLRAELGAVQTRFESTIDNLSVTSENLTASRSRIQDADFAAETANLTRAQILQQAGTSVLAQANSIPQNVLSLLG